MQRTRNYASGVRRAALALLLLVFTISGCTYVGKTIPQDERIALGSSGETVRGMYDDGMLRVDYQYLLRGSTMSLSGYIDFALRWESLDVYVLFIDNQGEVLDQKNIYASENVISLVRSRNTSFERTVEIPAGSAGISFRYSYMPSHGQR